SAITQDRYRDPPPEAPAAFERRLLGLELELRTVEADDLAKPKSDRAGHRRRHLSHAPARDVNLLHCLFQSRLGPFYRRPCRNRKTAWAHPENRLSPCPQSHRRLSL